MDLLRGLEVRLLQTLDFPSSSGSNRRAGKPRMLIAGAEAFSFYNKKEIL